MGNRDWIIFLLFSCDGPFRGFYDVFCIEAVFLKQLRWRAAFAEAVVYSYIFLRNEFVFNQNLRNAIAQTTDAVAA